LNRKPKIPLREKAVAVTGALTLAYTAWGLGGVIAWSMHIMLAGGLLTFLIALLPLGGKRDSRSGMRDSRSIRIPHRVSRISCLFFTSAFLLYLAIAALNPAWQIASDERGWWLESVAPPLAAWLPTSVEAPYEPMNAWRIFNMHLAAFSLALGLYLGLSSRRSTQFVLWSFLASVSLMAAVAIIQKYTEADAVLWTLKSENQNFWGSFFYRNQGTAFLNWGIVLAGVLYFYHARRSREAFRSGGPHFLAFCLIGLIAVSVALALSRGGILFAGILVGVFMIFVLTDYLYHTLAQLSRHTIWLTATLTLTLTLLLSVGLYQANRAIDWQAIEERFGDIGETIEDADRDARVLSSKLTWKMAQDQLWTGWGAGSFRYAFPMYQQEVPELFYQYHHRKKGWMGRKFFRYAHNDILQFLAEYGIVGCGLLLLSIASFLLPALSSIRHCFAISGRPPSPFAIFFLLAGLACAAAHAFLEFIFHSPSYWVALIGGLALVSRLMQLELKRS
jgi:O-antigen ligase